MADYTELRNLFDDNELRNRVVTATVIAAHTLAIGTPSAADSAWASAVFSRPEAIGKQALYAVLAANKDATVPNIQNATDAQIQTNVDAIVPVLVAALAGV